jgi:putative ABC transport system permease protein
MLKPAVRSLIRQPGFTCAAVATLTLGIAAATALFSTVNAALIEPLPYPRAQDIYTVRTYMIDGRFTVGLVATEEMSTLQRLAPSIHVALGARRDGTITADGARRQVVVYDVSPRVFDLFGLPMALGRGISGDDAANGAARVVVLSYGLWQRGYGGRRDVIGSAITFMDRPARVIGVAPAAFNVPAGTDVWANEFMPEGIGHTYDGYIRLAPGASVAALEPAMNQAMTALGKKYPDMDVGRAYRLTPLLATTVGDLGPILLILLGATGLLLVLAIVNVTNLLLARGITRAREIAVRTALGAGRARIAAGLLTEALLLACCGGALGIAAAFASTRVLLQLGAARLPRLATVPFDSRVVLFAVVLVVAIAVLIGVLPALRVADTDTSLILNESGRGVRGSRRARRLLGPLIAVELAVAVAVVAGAVRLVASYDRLQSSDPGFVADGRLVFDVRLPRAPLITSPAVYVQAQQQRLEWWHATEARLRQTGATGVAATSAVPLEHEWDSTTFVDIVSRPDIAPRNRPNGRLRVATPGFFSTMGMRLLAGRDFADSDTPEGQLVTIVNEEWVRRFLGDRDPLREQVKGFNFHVIDGKTVSDAIQIVGVVGNAKYASLTAAPEPTVYVPLSQTLPSRLSIVVTSRDARPEQHMAAFRQALIDVDRRLAIESTTLPSLVSSSISRQRLGMLLMSGFGLTALLLATVGVFAVVAYNVSQRLPEMAVRQALGATRADVYWTVVRGGSGVAVAGTIGGLVLAWWTGRLIGGYVYDVAPADPAVLAVSAGTVLLVALGAMLLTASRAASLDPARALRLE